MSTKPSTHAEWDTNGTNLSPTTAGHKSDGWATNEIPTSAEFNHWQKQVSDWTKWLYDGDVSFNNLKVSGDVRWLGSNTPTAYQMTGDLVSLPTSATDGYHTLEIGPDALKTVTTAYILHGIAHDGVAGRDLFGRRHLLAACTGTESTPRSATGRRVRMQTKASGSPVCPRTVTSCWALAPS